MKDLSTISHESSMIEADSDDHVTQSVCSSDRSTTAPPLKRVK